MTEAKFVMIVSETKSDCGLRKFDFLIREIEEGDVLQALCDAKGKENVFKSVGLVDGELRMKTLHNDWSFFQTPNIYSLQGYFLDTLERLYLELSKDDSKERRKSIMDYKKQLRLIEDQLINMILEWEKKNDKK